MTSGSKPNIRPSRGPVAAPRHAPLDPSLVPAGTVFRRVPGWPSYDVSPSGIVRSYIREDRTLAAEPQRVLKASWNRTGRRRVTLYDGRFGTPEHRYHSFPVDALVELAWGAPRPPAESPDPPVPQAGVDPEVIARWAQIVRGLL
jgi:hypothetical protein